MNAGLALAAGLLLQTTVHITTTVSSDHVAPGERFEILVEAETNGGRPVISLDNVAGFEIIPLPIQSRDRNNFPSGVTTVFTQRFAVVGHVEGRFTIPGVKVRVNGRTHTGGPVFVQVGPPPPVTPEDLVGPARLDVSVTPGKAWVGQAVTLRAAAMLPRELRSRLTRPATYEPPLAPGFWVVDLPNPLTVQLERIGGQIYEVQTYRRVYVPILPGRHVLAPARLNYEMRAGLMQPPESYSVQSDSIVIDVLPLPEAGKPASFGGAVGRYTLDASLEPAGVAVGEAATVRLAVRGTGNVKAVRAPALPAPSSIEILPPNEKATEDATGTTLGGVKEFRWSVVPREAGRVTLGPVEFSYFDPEADGYRVLRSDSLVLDVTGFSGSDEAQGLRPPDFAPSPPRLGFVRSKGFLAAQAIPLLLLLAGFARSRKPRPEPRAPEPDRVPEPGLDDLVEAARRGEAGVLDRLAARLRAGGGEQSKAITALLVEVDTARFAPRIEEETVIALVERSRRLLGRSPAGRRKGTVTPVLILILGLGVPGHFAVQADTFNRGVVAFARRDASTARAAFEDYVRLEPRDASGWYDLGNAAYREGDRGAATNAWLRALILDPRHSDARHNLLTVTGTASERFLTSRFSLGAEAALLAGAVAWWIAGILGFLLPRFRLAALLAAPFVWVLVGAAWMLGRSRPDLVTTRAEGVAIHGEPALQSEALLRVPAGEPLEIRARSGDWLRVRSAAGQEGWLEVSAVRFVSNTAPGETAP